MSTKLSRGPGGVSRTAAVLALAVIFTAALAYATVELPRVLNGLLLRSFTDVPTDLGPHGTLASTPDLMAFMALAEPIGYLSLAAVALLILAGFLTERRKVSVAGSLALFLPTFGYFAATMFILAGLGVLRVLWQPLWDVSPALFALGDVVLLPFWLLERISSFLLGPASGGPAGAAFAYTLIAAGLFLFSLGAFTWLYGRLQKKRLFDFWVYRYSRHPQYLGFIVWNYGVLLLAAQTFNPYWEVQPEPTLPWVISALVLVCVALAEENSMLGPGDQEYLAYRERTHFMLPLPRFLSRLCTAPIRAALGRDFPRGERETLYAFGIYLLIFVGVSALVALFEGPLLLLWP